MAGMPVVSEPASPPSARTPRERTLTIIIAVLVAALVVAPVATSLVFLTAWAPGRDVATGPVILFSPVILYPTQATIFVAAASGAWPASEFRVNVGTNGTLGTPTILGYSASVTVGSEVYLVAWWDQDGTGTVTAGDAFVVGQPGSGFPPDTLFAFLLLSTDGETIATASWRTPETPPVSRPVLTFGAVNLSSGNVTFSVASVSQAWPYTSYRFVLQAGTSMSSSVAIAAEPSYASITLDSTVYRVYWSDLGDEGNLNDGDNFRVTADGLPLPTGSFVFYLLWAADLAQIQTKSWQI